MEELKRIASFCVDHDKLDKGMYISRIDGDIITYDLRMYIPNGGVYMPVAGAHSFEHIFATLARNSEFKEKIIYVGPMGCRTGFYLVVRDMKHEDSLRLMQDILAAIAAWQGAIPGATRKECGNYRSQSLKEAKAMAADMQKVLSAWSADKMQYPQ